MKIGVISDTHGCRKTWQHVMKTFFSDVDMILHAGDILYHGPRNVIPAEYQPKELAEDMNSCAVPIVSVRGNCDAEVDDMVLEFPVLQEYQHLHLDGLTIVMNHGHHLPTDEDKAKAARKIGADIIITGHTHVAQLTRKDNILLLNPGSPGMTKRQDNKSTIAMIEDQTVTIYDIHSGEAIITETIAKSREDI